LVGFHVALFYRGAFLNETPVLGFFSQLEHTAATGVFVEPLIQVFRSAVDFFLHLDKHLDLAISQYGSGTYGLLFLIVFLETGLVVTPILPGDSLLFAAGTFAARGSLDLSTLLLLLTVAAVLGDAVNYACGKYLGPRMLAANSRFLKKEYLEKTERFYERYGGKTIILARFVPIVRTFAPFLAGIGKMKYSQFVLYNVVGAVLWVGVCTLAGFFFGNLVVVRENFTLVVLGIVFVSILPAIIEFSRSKAKSH
jgi:membrane-associated protein